MNALTALLLDDESRARRSLRTLLEEFCADVTVVAAVGSVAEAVEYLAAHRVDVVFLDVSMPEEDGFALAKRPEFADLNVVFVTAHADFALEAFRVNAVDYLLKPVNIEDLRTAVARVRKKLGEAGGAGVDEASLRIFANGAHQLIPIDSIDYLEADGSYTYVVAGGTRHMVSRRLKAFEEQLGARRFFRTHRSYLVNLSRIASVGALASGTVTLTDGTVVPLSRYRRGGLLAVV